MEVNCWVNANLGDLETRFFTSCHAAQSSKIMRELVPLYMF